MATMYDIIMGLPLFKGISVEQVSRFLEKTHVEIIRYGDGEQIVRSGEVCHRLMFVISGKCLVTRRVAEGEATINQLSGCGKLLCASNLFGMERESAESAVAIGHAGVLAFSKSQYMDLLQTDPIYLLNYFNYLSFCAQRCASALSGYSQASVSRILGVWLMAFTESDSEKIWIDCNDGVLSRITGQSEGRVESSLSMLAGKKLIERREDGIRILDRSALIDSASEAE